MKPKKIDRSTNKWEEIIEERLIKVPKVYKYIYQRWDDDQNKYVEITPPCQTVSKKQRSTRIDFIQR